MQNFIRDKSIETLNDEKYIGKIFSSNNFGDYKIIGVARREDNSKEKKYICEFLETKSIVLSNIGNILTGKIADYYKKTAFNVGYLGEAKRKNNKKAYEEWHDMIKRCYSDILHKKRPTYVTATVEKSWHNFSNYVKDRSLIIGYDEIAKYTDYTFCLDKDVFQDSKIHSSKTTCFIPTKINNFFTNEKSNNTTGYVGVYFRERNLKYDSIMSTDNTQRAEYGFDTAIEACESYFRMKKKYLCEILDGEYSWLDKRIKNALIEKLKRQEIHYLIAEINVSE